MWVTLPAVITERFRTKDGTELCWDELGTGPTVLFLHGIGSSRRRFGVVTFSVRQSSPIGWYLPTASAVYMRCCGAQFANPWQYRTPGHGCTGRGAAKQTTQSARDHVGKTAAAGPAARGRASWHSPRPAAQQPAQKIAEPAAGIVRHGAAGGKGSRPT